MYAKYGHSSEAVASKIIADYSQRIKILYGKKSLKILTTSEERELLRLCKAKELVASY